MEWIQEVLKLLFGQLGVVGTVCFIMSGYMAWLHDQERKDHKATRDTLQDLATAQAGMNLKVIEVLTEMKTLFGGLNGKRNS